MGTSTTSPNKLPEGFGKKVGGSKREQMPYSELSEERKEEIRAKHEEKHFEQGRETIGNNFYFGELVQRGKILARGKPSNFGKLPREVQAKVKENREGAPERQRTLPPYERH